MCKELRKQNFLAYPSKPHHFFCFIHSFARSFCFQNNHNFSLPEKLHWVESQKTPLRKSILLQLPLFKIKINWINPMGNTYLPKHRESLRFQHPESHHNFLDENEAEKLGSNFYIQFRYMQ